MQAAIKFNGKLLPKNCVQFSVKCPKTRWRTCQICTTNDNCTNRLKCSDSQPNGGFVCMCIWGEGEREGAVMQMMRAAPDNTWQKWTLPAKWRHNHHGKYAREYFAMIDYRISSKEMLSLAHIKIYNTHIWQFSCIQNSKPVIKHINWLPYPDLQTSGY